MQYITTREKSKAQPHTIHAAKKRNRNWEDLTTNEFDPDHDPGKSILAELIRAPDKCTQVLQRALRPCTALFMSSNRKTFSFTLH